METEGLLPQLAKIDALAGDPRFEALVQAIETVETWPAQLRVRALAVTPEPEERVRFSMRLAATRLPRDAQDTEG